MNEEKYTSDSDESDEDFCPVKAKNCDESVSEEEEEGEEEVLSDVEKKNVGKYKQIKGKKKIIQKSKQVNKDSSSEEENADIENEKRSNRVQTRTGRNVSQDSYAEKDKLESDDEEKVRTDSLWSSFLSDVKPTNSKRVIETTSTENTEKFIKLASTDAVNTELPSNKPIFKKISKAETINKSITVNEKSSVQQTEGIHNVDDDDDNSLIKKNQTNLRFGTACKTPIGIKRPVATTTGGLGSILDSIEKKKKVSVLEKSKIDWNTFKQDEGLDEELQTHNKGKDGYLERMDFLQRTDLRQFEIEKKLRISRRAK